MSDEAPTGRALAAADPAQPYGAALAVAGIGRDVPRAAAGAFVVLARRSAGGLPGARRPERCVTFGVARRPMGRRARLARRRTGASARSSCHRIDGEPAARRADRRRACARPGSRRLPRSHAPGLRRRDARGRHDPPGSRTKRFDACSTGPPLTAVRDGPAARGRPRHHRSPANAIEPVEARGKHLLIGFSGGPTLHTHLRMTGSWHTYRAGERWRRPRRRTRRRDRRTTSADAVCFDAPVVELLDAGRARAPSRCCGRSAPTSACRRPTSTTVVREPGRARPGDADRRGAARPDGWRPASATSTRARRSGPCGSIRSRRWIARSTRRRARTLYATAPGSSCGATCGPDGPRRTVAAGPRRLRSRGPPLPAVRHADPGPAAGRPRRAQHLVVPCLPDSSAMEHTRHRSRLGARDPALARDRGRRAIAFERGGNAIDAALAAATTLAVVYPHMCGVGGDLFALVQRPTGDVIAVNASGRAPAGRRPAAAAAGGRHDARARAPRRHRARVRSSGWEALHARGRAPWADAFDARDRATRTAASPCRPRSRATLAEEPSASSPPTPASRRSSSRTARRSARARPVPRSRPSGPPCRRSPTTARARSTAARSAAGTPRDSPRWASPIALDGPRRAPRRPGIRRSAAATATSTCLVIRRTPRGSCCCEMLALVERLGIDPDPFGPDAGVLAAMLRAPPHATATVTSPTPTACAVHPSTLLDDGPPRRRSRTRSAKGSPATDPSRGTRRDRRHDRPGDGRHRGARPSR